MTAKPNGFLITGAVCLDPEGNERLVTPIGLFSDREEAEFWIESRKPLWGNWEVVQSFAP